LKTTDVRFAGPVSPEGNDYTLEPQVFDEDFAQFDTGKINPTLNF